MTEWYYALIVTANGIILFFTLNAILKKCIKYYGVITKILAYAGFAVEILLLVILINLDYSKDLDIIKKKQEKNTAEIEHHTFHVNGDLDNTFTGTDSKPIKKQQKSPPTIKLSNEEILRQQKTALYQEGWKDEHINNGNLPNCYNFKPYRSKIDNYLSVYVGSGTDVVIKMMNVETNKCVRFVYINSGSTYKVRNIPEGRYYLKIAYGKEWISKVENGKCVGRFFRAAHYEQGEEIMDFNIKHYKDGRYSIPYFELKLDVVRTNDMNSFESDRISEETFNL
jgi:hypothetical protein